MNKFAFKQEITRLINNITLAEGIGFHLNYKMKIGNGSCPNIISPESKIEIGMKELLFPFYNISEIDYISTIITIFHENHHFIQESNYFNQDKVIDTDNIYMLINHIACIENYNYYLENYYNNPREIDAEREGILDAYNYFCDMYNKTIANDYIIKYINYKTSFVYFINKKDGCLFDNIDIINKAFKEVFKKSKNIPRRYNMDYENEDNPVIYGKGILDSDISCEIFNLHNPIIQDKFMAGLTLIYLKDKSDNYIYNNFKLLKKCDSECLEIVNEIKEKNINNDIQL